LGIGSAGEDEKETRVGAKTVIDVVESQRLVETGFDKKTFIKYIKSYMKRVQQYLEAHNPEVSHSAIPQSTHQLFFSVCKQEVFFFFFGGHVNQLGKKIIISGCAESGGIYDRSHVCCEENYRQFQ
jgi:hypothetical protein